jgi:hypothetical protein
MSPHPGEVWLADLGLAGKHCLPLSFRVMIPIRRGRP